MERTFRLPEAPPRSTRFITPIRPMQTPSFRAFVAPTFAVRALGLSLGLTVPLNAAPPETAPAFEWAAAASGLKNQKTRGIAVDREGNVFLTGQATDEVRFGHSAVKSAGG